MHELVFRSQISAPAKQVFAWHESPGAFERLNPAWKPVKILKRANGIRDGSQITIAIQPPFISERIWSIPWTLEHRNYRCGEQFQDVQVRGPFSSWEHTHKFISESEYHCTLEDRIQFSLPFESSIGGLITELVKKQLKTLFHYRHALTEFDLSLHTRFLAQERKLIAISGSSGFVGSSLIPFLTSGGHSVIKLQRISSKAKDSNQSTEAILWNPAIPQCLADDLRCDAVVHLAGENIAAKRWGADFKQRIRDSRVAVTHNLCRALAKLPAPPKVLVCASAVGYYGDRDDEELSEQSAPGTGFLADTCAEWERASAPAAEAGIRVVQLRIGIVLDPRGGALKKMLPPFLFGAGGRLGCGNQFMSWIQLNDLLAIIYAAIMDESMHGPYNAVAPQSLSNRDFTAVLGRVLGRPAIFPAPAPILRIALGEFADQALLASARVTPKRLLDAGFTFRWPQLESALRFCLGR